MEDASRGGVQMVRGRGKFKPQRGGPRRFTVHEARVSSSSSSSGSGSDSESESDSSSGSSLDSGVSHAGSKPGLDKVDKKDGSAATPLNSDSDSDSGSESSFEVIASRTFFKFTLRRSPRALRQEWVD